jgi:translation initiation factor IF-2
MGNVRVFQLARDLGLTSQEIIERLHGIGVEVRTASSSVDEDTADKLKRTLTIDAVTSRRRRVYGSEEDEAEREQAERAQAERIAAERAERERAAQEAAEARRVRKARGGRREPVVAKPVSEDEPPPALVHPPGAPRLAPKVAHVPAPPVEGEEEELPQAEAPAASESAEMTVAPEEAVPVEEPVAHVEAPPVAPVAVEEPQEPVAPPAPRVVVRTPGPLRPIAPPAPVKPPEVHAAEPAPAPPTAEPPAPTPIRPPTPQVTAPTAPRAPRAPRVVRPLRPIAPPRPISPHPTSPHMTARPAGPHPTASTPLPRSPHPVGGVRAPVAPARPAPPSVSRRTARKVASRAAESPRSEERPTYSGPPRKIVLTEGVTVKELGERMEDVKSRDIIKTLIGRGIMATINSSIDHELAIQICKEFGYEATIQSFEEVVVQEQVEESKPENQVPRAPVVTVMGHVDHGKTSLLDAIRETSVVSGEAGGITQHIGAYHVDVGDRKVVFLDTPGHEAFTLMRARGARVTDVVVLVVAADDGVMPQTVEAIDHAKAAGVPILVAVNKIDKPDANKDRVRQQLSDRGLMPEDWGGSTVFVDVSAKKKQNLEQLLEMILLVSDLQELKADPTRPGVGTVLDARLDKGRGPVATVLVQDGTLRVGDTTVVGAVSGKVRALVDDQGHRLKLAAPSTPVEVLGLGGLPEPGDQLLVIADSAKAQAIVSFRQAKLREQAMAASSKIRLEDLGRAIAEGQIKELPLVLKADVQGSVEALSDQLGKIPQEKIKLRIIRSGAGAITEGDVLLASASNAVVIGFNVRPERKAAETAERDDVDIHLYTVIYDAVEEMRKALEGLLEPTTREVRLGSAEVRETFRISKVGTIAGCMVSDGKVTRSGQVRLLRDNVVVVTGKVSSLKRFKDDASEVKAGLECGIGIAGYNDVKPGDVIEFFTTEQVKVTLE